MSISEDILMAYADGELDSDQRTEVEVAMANDPNVAARVEQHRALRLQIQSAFAPVLEEELPARLELARLKPQAANGETTQKAGAHLVQLDSVRQHLKETKEKKERLALQTESKRIERQRDWRDWGGLAAMLVLGLLFGQSSWFRMESTPVLLSAAPNGELVAQGKLAAALDGRLANDTKRDEVKIGLSFKSKDGQYCRSFATSQNSGVACHVQNAWTIALMLGSPAEGVRTQSDTTYRQASSEVAPLILEFIDQNISGQSLDQNQERAALAQQWK